ncbi:MULTISPECIES: hypothetical protein [unclassified Streptomyces]|nr:MULTISPECIES: hypothetical protein [unclassified Streptomyces]MYT71183.1 hypothetical protein [Streptomyces sp. SID8367]RAJ69592.1 hypothetical protein K377_07986 [Streptomyces sp. PsTaAH-137]
MTASLSSPSAWENELGPAAFEENLGAPADAHLVGEDLTPEPDPDA